MFARGLERHQINDIDYTNLQLGKMLTEKVYGSERLQRRNVAGASHHHIRLRTLIVAGPFPDAYASGAVFDRRIHVQPLMSGLFASDDHVDIVAAPQTMIGHGKQRIGVGRKINADYFRLFINDVIYEAGVLVAETVVILPPDVRCQQIVERSNRATPRDVARSLQPLGMLVEHRINDMDERFVTVEESVTTCQKVAFKPALTEVLAQNLHHPAIWREMVIPRQSSACKDSVRHFKESVKTVRGSFVRPHHPKVPAVGVALHHVAQEASHRACRLRLNRSRFGNVNCVIAEIRHLQISEQKPAVSMRIGSHAALALRGQLSQFRHQFSVLIEEFFGLVAPQPLFQHPQMFRLACQLR